MLWNTLLLALRAIRRNVMRSFLTILGIVIGVGAVITMVTLGNGATQVGVRPDSEHGQQPADGAPRAAHGPGRDEGAPNFKFGDAEAIQAQIGGLEAVAPTVCQERDRGAHGQELVDVRHRDHQRVLQGGQLAPGRRAASSPRPRSAPEKRSA